MDVHPIAAAGFGSAPDAYEKGRPGYPEAAVRWLAERTGLARGATVVDLAAGTGKLTQSLARTGAEVIAVEPIAAMRTAIPAPARAVEGTAEAIPLESASTDVVTVAQAFHWFDGDAALAEIHRVLRPGGSLALLWNVRRLEEPVHAAIEELIAPYYEGVPRHRQGKWREAFERTTLFGPLEQVEFENEQRLDADGLAARFGSTSVIAALPAGERSAFLGRVRALAEGGTVTLGYQCRVQVADRLDN